MITCDKCNGACCRYVTVPLDEPEDKADWDHIKWLVAHQNVVVYKDNDGDWLAEFQTPCKYLKDNRCSIYPHRPDICSEHDVEECIINGEGEVCTVLFKDISDIEEYLKKLKKPKSVDNN